MMGYCEVERKYPDRIITDRFLILRKMGSATDAEGNCYDWYEIGRHNRLEDKITPQIGSTEQEITDCEIQLMEQEQMITDNEIGRAHV